MKKSELKQLIKQCILQGDQPLTYNKIIITLQDYNKNIKYLTVTSKPFVGLGKAPGYGGFGLSNVFLQTNQTRGTNYIEFQKLIKYYLIELAEDCNWDAKLFAVQLQKGSNNHK